MDEIRMIAPTGVLGSGYLKESLDAGLKLKPHFIGVDAGSTDPGPHFLGTGTCAFSKQAYKRDLTPLLLGTRSLSIPLAIGSAGTAGGEIQLQWAFDIVKEIAADNNLHFKIALIHAEQRKDYLISQLKAGKIKPLKPELPISEAVITRSEHIVAMMGAEPYMQALKEGADVILAGRSSDPAIFAAFCMQKGYDPGLAWHAGKILECGTAATVFRKRPDCILAYLHKDHFIVEPLDPDARCSPQSIAAHSFYENYDPFYIQESSGLLDISQASYQAVSDRAVKVSGSKFVPQTPPTLKLEGAEFAGYQSVLIGSIRDPIIIRQIDSWMTRLKEKAAERIAELYPAPHAREGITIFYHVYGKDGTMGPLEPVRETLSHELCLIVEVTAGTQEIATTIAGSIRHIALHLPVPEWSGIITGLATPFSPPYIERGAIYRFNLNHVLEVENPLEAFQIEMISI